MDAKRTYIEPVLVDLGGLISETLGIADEGPEPVTMTLPDEDI